MGKKPGLIHHPPSALSMIVSACSNDPVLRDAATAVKEEFHALQRGYVVVEDAQTCATHHRGLLLGKNKTCHRNTDDRECEGLPLYRRVRETW